MQESVEQLIATMRDEGSQKFSKWNAESFESFVTGPVKNLAMRVKWDDKEDPDWETVKNFLQVVYAGIGEGVLWPTEAEVPAKNFFSYYLSDLAPYQVTQVERKDRAKYLQHVWNIGDGMAKEPRWLNQFVIAKTDWSVEGSQLPQHIANILDPVLTTRPPATWTGSFQLHELDLKAQFPHFLPGKIYLCSPNVLCVEDRISPPETIGIFLQKNQVPEILGAVGKLPEYHETFDCPEILAEADRIKINEREVDTPWIQHPREFVCVQSGYVVVSAEDSQRLWMVEAA